MLTHVVRPYKSKSTMSLINSLLVLNSCKFRGLVKAAPKILKASDSLGLSMVSNSFIKHTFFKYFCGGENLSEVVPVMKEFRATGIGSILDLAIEESGSGSPSAARVTDMFCKSIDIAKHAPDNFISIKVSALCNVWDFQDKDDMNLNTICRYAKENGVKVMIDAEGSFIQPKIDEISRRLAETWNTDSAVVWNTYQMYLKNSLPRLIADLKQRKHQFVGIKLVRGAYMASEPASLFHSSLQETHDNYDSGVRYCINEITNGETLEIMLATHNEKSIQSAIDLTRNQKYSANIKFGQLYGMKDDITFSLAHAGFNVYKYIPYGPVGTALPYLLRRAHENSNILSNLMLDKRLYMAELAHRFKKI